jgi:putative salt-induced outer membrane protein YdiY
LYLLGDVSYLSNTEQALTGRITPSVGFGRFLISSNKLYLGLSLGFTYNIENYVDTSLNKTSGEVVLSADFNMFDFEDITLTSGIDFYASLSEKGRLRSDYDLTLKYDLPFDFYIKLGFTLNYDNQPAIAGNDFDYIFNSGFGWSLN